MGKRKKPTERRDEMADRRQKTARDPDAVIKDSQALTKGNLKKWDSMGEKRLQAIQAIETVVAKTAKLIRDFESENPDGIERGLVAYYTKLLTELKNAAKDFATSIDDSIRAGFFKPETEEEDFYGGVEQKKRSIAMLELQAEGVYVEPLQEKSPENT